MPTSPVPWLLRSLRRLETHHTEDGEEIPGADFVLIPCNTAHLFLEDLRAATSLPLLNMVGLCAQHIGRLAGPESKIGLLATTGTLKSGLYHRALEAHGLLTRSPLDDENGEEKQRNLVMAAIFGPHDTGQGESLGLKNLGEAAISGARRSLLQAAELLVSEMGCQVVIAACTEIPLAFPEQEVLGVPLIDPLEILAKEAIIRVYGLSRGPS
jgi:aspartate racemase